MTGDEMRDQLTEAMHEARCIYYEDMADALLPVVRKIAAEELRAAAEESTYWVMTRETVYTRLNEHADALDPS